LFCTKNYDYDELSQIINGKHISIDQVSKMDVVDGKFKVYLDSNEHSFSLKEMKRSVPEICMECEDYSAEFADISIGSNGSSKGWSTVIIRTEKGLQLFTDLENKGYIETKPIDNLQIVVSNSTRKHQKAVNL
jgi:coenzyme F420 hydrogenase subunit beta